MSDSENKQKTDKKIDGILCLKNVTKKFGDNVVLDDLSVCIEKGKTTVVLGPSGCGKTVFIKHLIMLLRPTDGEVYYRDRRLDTLSERELNHYRLKFGFLFQNGALFDSMTVAENILFPVKQHLGIKD